MELHLHLFHFKTDHLSAKMIPAYHEERQLLNNAMKNTNMDSLASNRMHLLAPSETMLV